MIDQRSKHLNYHGPKCKYILNHINFVNKIPSQRKRFQPSCNLHEINTTTTLLPMIKLKVHKVIIFKNLQVLKPYQTMLPFTIDLALSIFYLFAHSKAKLMLQSFQSHPFSSFLSLLHLRKIFDGISNCRRIYIQKTSQTFPSCVATLIFYGEERYFSCACAVITC